MNDTTFIPPINAQDFIHRVIEDGINAVKNDYKKGDSRRDGAINGFESCRFKSLDEMVTLLLEARKKTQSYMARYHDQQSDKNLSLYWYWQARCSEIEWVVNCVASAMALMGNDVGIMMTARGMNNALRIITGKESIK